MATEYDTFETLRNPLYGLQIAWQHRLNDIFKPNIRVEITPCIFGHKTYEIRIDLDQTYSFTNRIDDIEDYALVEMTFNAIVHDLLNILIGMT